MSRLMGESGLKFEEFIDFFGGTFWVFEISRPVNVSENLPPFWCALQDLFNTLI